MAGETGGSGAEGRYCKYSMERVQKQERVDNTLLQKDNDLSNKSASL